MPKASVSQLKDISTGFSLPLNVPAVRVFPVPGGPYRRNTSPLP
jgi:hypothetical protein